MNKNIKDKNITTKFGDTKNHQAFAMELSRLKKAKKVCEETKNCFEYNKLGGDARFTEVNKLVELQKKIDEERRKAQKDTNPNNMYQNINPMKVSTPNVTKKSDHSGGENKILTNSQALNEITLIKYLIKYLDNNGKL